MEKIEHIRSKSLKKATKLKGQVEDVKTVLHDTIDKMTQRGEGMERLADATDVLATSSTSFGKSSSGLRRKYTCQNRKLNIAIAVISIIVLIAVILLIVHYT